MAVSAFLMLAGAAQQGYVIQPGPEWLPLKFEMDVAKGSALDWSPSKIVPAGSKGWVRATRDGHFEFEKEPGKRVRFYGVNVCFGAAVPDKPTAVKAADRLMRMGYNTVRFHHYDVEITGGWERAKDVPSTLLEPKALDRMDYFASELKKRGMYLTLDFFTIRQLMPNEYGEGDIGGDDYKAALLVSEKARENWWKYTRNLLEHKNPYTGLKWKDDPAVPWLCLVNENDFGSVGRGEKAQEMFTKAFNDAGYKGKWTWESPEGAKFASELHVSAYRWMRDKLRSIGAKAMLTDVNGWWDQMGLMKVRNELDFVDNHNYWDHPRFLGTSWGLPSTGWSGNGSAIKSLGGGLGAMSLTRIKGKPFTVTEFNFSGPNAYRAEGGLFFGALAAVQDWDGLWRFAWSHNLEALQKPLPLDYFNVAADPIMMASERAAIALFLRRDLAPAMDVKHLQIDLTKPQQQFYDLPQTKELFEARLFSTFDKAAKDRDANNPTGVRIDDKAGTFAVSSAQTCGVVAPQGKAVTAGVLRVESPSTFSSFCASSLDGRPLTISRRILLTHLTDVQNSGATFEKTDRAVITKWGALPHLVKAGTGKVSLAVQNPASLKVYRLDMAGRRIEEIKANRSGGRLTFTTNNKGPKGPTFYYELVR